MKSNITTEQSRKAQKEQQIFDASLALIEQVGLAGVSMEAIARKAKMATGTVYIYFKSKEELLNALYLHTKLIFAQSILKPCAPGAPVRLCFQQVCMDYMRYLMQHSAELVFMHQFGNSAYLSEAVKDTTLQYIQPLFRLMEKGKEELLLKELDTLYMIAFLNGTMSSVAGQLKNSGKRVTEKDFALAASLCWDALKR